MEFQYYGANCVRLTTRRASIVIDDNLRDLGQKGIVKSGEVVLYTSAHGMPPAEAKLALDHPGEYEVSDTSIQGIAVRAYIDKAGQSTATMFKVVGEDIRVAVVGHVYPELNSSQLENLGAIDVLIIPVGGNGFTLDGVGASHLIKEIEPKLVIPTHYDDKALKYPVSQQPLEEALKGLGMEPRETVAKLKLKAGELDDLTQLVVLERQ